MIYTESGNRRTVQPGAIPTDLEMLENLDDWEIVDDTPDPRGYDLIGRDLERGAADEKIGTIDGLLASPATQRAYFAVVDTGGWFSNKRFLVPLDGIEFRDGSAYGPFVKERFENAPEWHEGDRDWDRHYAYWSGLYPEPGAAPVTAEGATIEYRE